jgi:tRNA 2-selenouridine synthase
MESLAAGLMAHHYDPAYARERSRHERPVLARLEASRLDQTGLEALAGEIEAALG